MAQAREIDAENQDAKQAMEALAAALLRPAQDALAAGKLDEAERALKDRSSVLAADPAWQKLSAQLAQQRLLAEQKLRIDALLADTRRQLTQGRVAEPMGDNALESLARIAEVDPANSEAAKLRVRSADALALLAKQAESKGEFSAAFSRYEQALQADPSNVAYINARKALEQRLGERDTQIVRALTDARTAIAERRFFAPASRSARDYLTAALSIDPGNAQAKELQTQLPAMVRESAQAMATEGKLDEALVLLGDAQKAYANDAQLKQLVSQLSAARDRSRVVEARTAQLVETRSTLAQRPLGVEDVSKVATALEALLKNDANDADALRLREQLVQILSRDVAAAGSGQAVAALAPLVDQIEKTFGAGGADVRKLVVAFAKQRSDVIAREDAQRLATQGALVLNAYPWANVESVVEQASGRSVELPADRATPLRLSVPAGTYRITFKHPDVRQPVIRVSGLDAKQTQQVSASFPTITADAYLRKAGYAR